MNDLYFVFCTFPNLESARQIGTILVDTQLAACVNLCPQVESIYRWQGEVETAAEVLAIFKTTASAWPRFEARLTELHPYDTPEIVAQRAVEVNGGYADWVMANVKVP
jgi:periplasmic divalent cation tolerance protein